MNRHRDSGSAIRLSSFDDGQDNNTLSNSPGAQGASKKTSLPHERTSENLTLAASSGPPTGSSSAFLTGPALWTMFVAQCLASSMITLYVMIIATAIPSITAAFNSIQDLDWYSTGYLVSLCSFQPLSGKLYTLFPTKPTYLVFMAVFEVGNLICALSHSSPVFIVGRAIAGMGAAGLFTGGMIMLLSCAPPPKRPVLISSGMAVTAIGGVVGPVVGGAITQYMGWRWCFWLFLPLGCVSAVLILLVRIPEQTIKPPMKATLRLLPQRLDLLGFGLFVPACFMILLGLSWGGQKLHWKSATVIGLLCGGAGTCVLFAAWQRHYQDKALIPPRILLQQVVLFGSMVSFLQGGAFLEMGYYMPLWFQSVKHASPTSSGLMLLPTMISQIIASVLSGVFMKQIAYVVPWALFGNLCVSVGAGLMTTWHPNTNEATWIGYQILVGAGRGLVLQMPVIALQNTLSGLEVAMGTSVIMFMQYFGGAVFLSIAKTIFTNELRTALHKYAPNIDSDDIVNAGATDVFNGLSGHDLAMVLKSYNQGLAVTFWLPTAAGILAFFTSLGLGWEKVSGNKKPGRPS